MNEPAPEAEPTFVGRGGLKLHHALQTFSIDPTGLCCADFGCNLGGFTDCLLKAGASSVYAVDTGYGILDYRLRIDDRVVVMERTNAMHADAPAQKADLIAIDMGWTPQKYCIPAALRWLTDGGRIISLIKPHYERSHGQRGKQQIVLTDDEAHATMEEALDAMPALGAAVIDVTKSPILGGKTRGNKKGNVEYLALLERVAT